MGAWPGSHFSKWPLPSQNSQISRQYYFARNSNTATVQQWQYIFGGSIFTNLILVGGLMNIQQKINTADVGIVHVIGSRK